MPASTFSLATAVATRRLLRLAALFGLLTALVALLTTFQQASDMTTVLIAVAWVLMWGVASRWPDLIGRVLRHWRWTAVVVASLSALTILASGDFDSLLKANANWLAWAGPVVLGTGPSLYVATALSSGLLGAYLISGMSVHTIVDGPDRYTAVTDILNPLVIVLVALAVTGAFRMVLAHAGPLLQAARRGDGATSPVLGALLARPARSALPAASVEAVPEAPTWQLSPTEHEIVDRLADGETPQQIALARGVRDDTIYDQIGSAKRKAGARTIEHLVALAWQPQS